MTEKRTGKKIDLAKATQLPQMVNPFHWLLRSVPEVGTVPVLVTVPAKATQLP
jgi:hypothetical protein